MTVKTVIFRRFLFVGAPNGLRIVCGVSIRKSVNSAGLEQDFFQQKQAFYLCCDYRYHDPKCDYDKADGGKTELVTLFNVDIQMSSDSAIKTTGQGAVTLELNGTNIAKSNTGGAGIQKMNTDWLVIQDNSTPDGSLTAAGGDYTQASEAVKRCRYKYLFFHWMYLHIFWVLIRPCISTGPTCQNTYYNLPK